MANFLLGKGEKLTEPVVISKGGGSKKPPYTFAEAKRELTPRIETVAQELKALPEGACPEDEAVAKMQLHPAFIAKTSYPTKLLKSFGLRTVGSRSAIITPRKWTKKKEGQPTTTTEIFVAGLRENFQDFAQEVVGWTKKSYGAEDIMKLENFRTIPPQERIKPINSDAHEPLLEVVMHAGSQKRNNFILEGFEAYLESLGVAFDLSKRIDTELLSFIPVRIPKEKIEDLAKFSFLRLAREMPSLRYLGQLTDGYLSPKEDPFPFSLPTGGPVDPTIRVALFDGGGPDIPAWRPWVNWYDPEDIGKPEAKYEKHGVAVTSAFLFGSLKPGVTPPMPYAKVDHYRVIDKNTEKDPQGELYPTLKRILKILEENEYDFVSIQVGPKLPIDDDDVHPWTAKLDPLLAKAGILANISAGNSGEGDPTLGLNRVQPPSDIVNGLAIGACDNESSVLWKRASYSSVGRSPAGAGRRPGLIKPNIMSFGGVKGNSFFTANSNDPELAIPTQGTSIASPNAMRIEAGIRAYLGPVLTPLAIQALLTHKSQRIDHDPLEVGFGRIPTDIEQLITCGSNTVQVVYQGELEAKKYLRAEIPVIPNMVGRVIVTATICFRTDVDPHDPMQYTRSGLEIFFRRDRLNIPPGKQNAKTTQFFKSNAGRDEIDLRTYGQKWETTLHASRRFEGSTLKAPVFDIHYNPRESGRDVSDAPNIPYAMIISLMAPKISGFYDQIWARYRFQLERLQPVIQIPIQIGGQ